MKGILRFFPACQVMVIRFYVSYLLRAPPVLCFLCPAFRLPPVACLLLVLSSSSLSNCDPQRSLPDLNHDHPCQCSLPDLNHEHPRPIIPAGPQPRPVTPSIPCRTSTANIHAKYSLLDLNREYSRQIFPA